MGLVEADFGAGECDRLARPGVDGPAVTGPARIAAARSSRSQAVSPSNPAPVIDMVAPAPITARPLPLPSLPGELPCTCRF